MGVKRFGDPALSQEFSTVPLALDVAALNSYAVDWRPGSLVFRVNGDTVRTLDQAPDYPVQLMIGVFDFPAKSVGDDEALVPELIATEVRGRPAS